MFQEPNRYKYFSNTEENEIRNIFHQHWYKLENELGRAIQVVSNWRDGEIKKIVVHAETQMSMLKAHYADEYNILIERRKEAIVKAKICHDSNQSREFDEVYKSCESFKLKIAHLEHIPHELMRIQVKPENNNINVKDKQNSPASLSTTSAKVDIFVPNGIRGYSTGISVQPITPVSPKDHLPFFGTSPYNNSTSAPCSAKVNDLNEQCPLCYMIFPLSMANNQRQQHVNDHLGDNHDLQTAAV